MARHFQRGARTVWRLLTALAVAWAVLGFIAASVYLVAFVAPLVILWMAYVWPTEWHYHHHNGFLLRAHRFDGAIETFTAGGWVLVQRPSEEAVTGHIPSVMKG